MDQTVQKSKLNRLISLIRYRPRFFLCILLGITVTLAAPQVIDEHNITRLIIGWNAGTLVYLALTAHMMFSSSHEKMRERALQHCEGRIFILVLVVSAVAMCLGAIVVELSVAKDLHGPLRVAHAGLAAFTIVTTWLFTQVMFALHYAHDYYVAELSSNHGGLLFPNEKKPDYADFLYFACIIGTSAQTADVSFTSRSMRRAGLAHCVVAFFFNTSLLALAINIASSLL